ncbi:MAG TPA: hypothetical protein DF383_07570, partial [Deltaproteobacteria bacterium]|nr:hypothetical protein [Deltaproteobacteria bacterium]
MSKGSGYSSFFILKYVFITTTFIIVGFFVGLSPTQAALPTIPFTPHELKEGNHSVSLLIAVPQVGEMSGQLSYSYNIAIPAGRGVTPKLQLEYSSGARYSEFGYGWQLSLATIERSQRKGIVDYNSDLFLFREGHSTTQLIPTGETTPNGGKVYRERVEKSFNQYIRYGNTWRILGVNGLRYELGT